MQGDICALKPKHCLFSCFFLHVSLQSPPILYFHLLLLLLKLWFLNLFTRLSFSCPEAITLKIMLSQDFNHLLLKSQLANPQRLYLLKWRDDSNNFPSLTPSPMHMPPYSRQQDEGCRGNITCDHQKRTTKEFLHLHVWKISGPGLLEWGMIE